MIFESDISDISVSSCLLIFCISVCLLSLFVQAYFYLNYFLPFSRYQNNNQTDFKFGASIVVAAKNERENLKRLIPSLLNQTHSLFEIIVVDDHSTDDTRQFLTQISDNRLLVVQLEKGNGKKAAIQCGIEQAKYDYFVFTDADCLPQSEYWLGEMLGGFSENKEIVLGHSNFVKSTGFLNKLIRYESFMVATQYFSFALKGIPYMGVGRNLAYTRSVYERSASFQEFENIRSGDDDLLVNEMANSQNVSLVSNPKAHTKSYAEKSLKTYFFQKRRQLQAGEHYKGKHRFLLAVLGLSTLLFNTCTLILLYFSRNWALIITIFVLYWFLKAQILKRIANKLGDRDVIQLAWLLELCQIVAITAIGVSTWIWKVDKWK